MKIYPGLSYFVKEVFIMDSLKKATIEILKRLPDGCSIEDSDNIEILAVIHSARDMRKTFREE